MQQAVQCEVTLRNAVNGRILGTLVHPLDEQLCTLRDAIVAFLDAKNGSVGSCWAPHLLLEGKAFPDEGSLRCAIGNDQIIGGDAVCVTLDVVQSNGVWLNVQALPSNDLAMTNKVYRASGNAGKVDASYVEIKGFVFAMDSNFAVEERCVALGKMQRELAGVAVGELVFVANAVPSEVASLSHCSLQVDVVGGGFVAPALRERLQIQRAAIERELQACNRQVLAIDQSLVLRLSGEGHILKLQLVSVGPTGSPGDGITCGFVDANTQVEFREGPTDSVRLV